MTTTTAFSQYRGALISRREALDVMLDRLDFDDPTDEDAESYAYEIAGHGDFDEGHPDFEPGQFAEALRVLTGEWPTSTEHQDLLDLLLDGDYPSTEQDDAIRAYLDDHTISSTQPGYQDRLNDAVLALGVDWS